MTWYMSQGNRGRAAPRPGRQAGRRAGAWQLSPSLPYLELHAVCLFDIASGEALLFLHRIKKTPATPAYACHHTGRINSPLLTPHYTLPSPSLHTS